MAKRQEAGAPIAIASTGTIRIFPTQLQIGDRMSDSTGEWEVVGRPYTTAGAKNAHIRVQRVEQPGVTEVRMRGRARKSA